MMMTTSHGSEVANARTRKAAKEVHRTNRVGWLRASVLSISEVIGTCPSFLVPSARCLVRWCS